MLCLVQGGRWGAEELHELGFEVGFCPPNLQTVTAKEELFQPLPGTQHCLSEPPFQNESQNHKISVLEGTLGTLKSMGRDTFHYTRFSKPCPTSPGISLPLGWSSFSGQPVPGPHHPHRQEFSPNIHLVLPSGIFKLFPPFPVTPCLFL